MSLRRITDWIGQHRIDLLWLSVVAALAALAATRHHHNPFEFLAVAAVAILQIVEMRYPFFMTRWGAVSAIVVKLGLAWALVWLTEGIESSYFLIFLLPVVTAASALGLAATLLTALASSGAYCSFLLFIPWDQYELDVGGRTEIAIRVLFIFMTGILLNHFVTDSRRQAVRYRSLSEDLVAANQELRQAQAQVRRSERLAALGQLSAGLAHELRNKLGVIRGSAEVVLNNVPTQPGVAREMASMTMEEVDRTNGLVTRFLEFARPSHLHRSVQDLNPVIERAIDQLRQSLRQPASQTAGPANNQPPGPESGRPAERASGDSGGLKIESQLARDLPAISYDADLLERVFFNLLKNGAEAMPAGGTLRVVTRQDDGVIEAEISDTGEGILPENVESIFNPFFTTKPGGIGLGLAIVSKIIDDHGGKITVRSRPGEGTTFRVSLPLSNGDSGTAKS